MYRVLSDYTPAYFDSQALKAVNIEDHYKRLDKLIWDMQDAFDELVQEGYNQLDAMSDFETVFAPSFGTKEVKVKEAEVKPKTIMCDKAVQVGTVSEDVHYIKELERRHLNYMLEAFSHLRFSIELITSVPVANNSKSKQMASGSKN